MHKLPLVFFTVLSQAAVGMIFLSALILQFDKTQILNIQKVNLVAVIFMFLALLLATFHLGKPFRAFNVLFGVGRSAMSNEIIAFSLLFGLVALYLFLDIVMKVRFFILKGLSLLAAIVSVVIAIILAIMLKLSYIINLAFIMPTLIFQQIPWWE